MQSRIVRFTDAPNAFWYISQFLAPEPAYRSARFGDTVPRLQRYVTLGNYVCLVEGTDLKAVIVWSDIDVEKLLSCQSQQQPYVPAEDDKKDGVMIAAIRAVDRKSLQAIVGAVKRHVKGKRILWDRHREREPRLAKP